MRPETAVEEYARRQLEKLGKSAKQLRHADPMAIHDARVAIRRLDAALDVLHARGPRAPRPKECRVLRKLRRRLGPLREREGIVQALRARLEQEEPLARQAGERLLDRLAKRVTRARRRVVRRIERRHRQVFELRASAEPRRVPEPGAMTQEARRWANTRRADAVAATAVARRTRTPEDLHEARKAVKQWRYSLEVLALASGQPDDDKIGRVTELQRCLGSIHDDDVLLAFLRRWSRRWRRAHHAERAAALSPLMRRLGVSRRREVRRLDDLSETAGLLSTS